ncbi:MAG: hypothetical protein JST19_07085 [Bacteroidetes bacterium]|nr:hypothetical protein [Bacteroidota bacterium]
MRKLLFLIVACLVGRSIFAQVDTIRLKDKRLNTSALKPGLHQYLVYFQNPKSKQSLRFWYWLRDTKLESRDGQKMFAITQHWYGSDSTTYRQIYSLNKADDFAPVYESLTMKGITKAYNWSDKKVWGADSAANNTQKDFSLDFKTPNLNWELDIETLEMLPLAAGKTFVINFYDAGLSPPEYVTYKVTGSEVLSMLDNQKLDCWVILTEGNNGNTHYTQTFWISKKNHEFLKEEDSFNGMYRYKIKMPAMAPDLVARFK